MKGLRPDLFAGIVPFVRVAEEKSFARAAASMGLTTAAVSKAVRKLEDDMGARLFDRTSRVVALTREGEEIFSRCQEAVLAVRGARAAIEGRRREPRGEVSVTIPFILAPFVVRGLARLSSRHPKLVFRVDVSDRVAKLAGEGYDVAVRTGPLRDSGLVARSLRRTRWVTVASPSYLAKHTAPRTPADLAGHNALRFVAPDGKPRDFVFREGERGTSVAVSGNLTIDHGPQLLDAAVTGLGVAQVLDFMVDELLRQGSLVEVLGGASARGPDVYAVTSPTRASSANVRAFVAFLVEALASPA